MFQRFEIETSSTCNRTCPSCLRNSIPNRDLVKNWFTQNLMPLETIYNLFDQLVKMDFKGSVCLQHYNEPLQDPRIVDIARHVKNLNQFQEIFICTNADYIDEELAKQLDGTLDNMRISLYMDDEAQQKRMAFLNKLFSKTKLLYTGGVHSPTHHSPKFDLMELTDRFTDQPCHEPGIRLIINHKGDCLLCCSDLTGNFDLGNIKDHTLYDLWFNEKHQNIIKDLQLAGGRRRFKHCASCPVPYYPAANGLSVSSRVK